MIEMRPSKREELLGQMRLWKLAFGDDESYIGYFYEHCASPQDMMVLLDDGELRSMLALLPMTVALPDGKKAKGAYVYALATDPDVRKKGYGRQLLQYADFYLKEQGMDCVTVVPAEAGLHRFFATVDYLECFSTRKLELLSAMVEPPRPAGGIVGIGAAEYNEIRERLLKNTFHAAYDEHLIEFQRGVSRMSGANLYRITVDGEEGCATAEYVDDESLSLKELLLPPRHFARAVALVKGILPAERYYVRTPALWDGLPGSYTQPFAMIKWFDPNLRRAWLEEKSGYFGLGFD